MICHALSGSHFLINLFLSGLCSEAASASEAADFIGGLSILCWLIGICSPARCLFGINRTLYKKRRRSILHARKKYTTRSDGTKIIATSSGSRHKKYYSTASHAQHKNSIIKTAVYKYIQSQFLVRFDKDLLVAVTSVSRCICKKNI